MAEIAAAVASAAITSVSWDCPRRADPARLGDLPAATLAAGREVPNRHRILAETNQNIVGLVLEQEGPFHILEDRKLEVTSQVAIDVEAQVMLLESRLER